MKTRNYSLLPALLTLGIATLSSPGSQAQPLDDRVTVDMPYTTTIGHKTLAPGEYVIQRLPSQSGSRVLLIYSDKGMKFETSAMTIPVLDINVARDTKIVLDKIGDDYYYDKVWVQGKSYGYQFILPKEARMRRKELAKIIVPASSSSGSSTVTTTTTTASAETPVVAEEQQTIAQAEVGQPVEVAQVEERTEIAETPAPVTPEAEQLPQSANREMDQNPATTTESRSTMPHTATTWLAMMLGGSTLLGAGMLVRRRA